MLYCTVQQLDYTSGAHSYEIMMRSLFSKRKLIFIKIFTLQFLPLPQYFFYNEGIANEKILLAANLLQYVVRSSSKVS